MQYNLLLQSQNVDENAQRKSNKGVPECSFSYYGDCREIQGFQDFMAIHFCYENNQCGDYQQMGRAQQRGDQNALQRIAERYANSVIGNLQYPPNHPLKELAGKKMFGKETDF